MLELHTRQVYTVDATAIKRARLVGWLFYKSCFSRTVIANWNIIVQKIPRTFGKRGVLQGNALLCLQ